jgi:hypothetical protein
VFFSFVALCALRVFVACYVAGAFLMSEAY